jgi:short-subunit dehydrogenase
MAPLPRRGRLASQGINVFVVALDDKLMEAAIPSLRSRFPGVQIVPIPVDLSDVDGAVEAIHNATSPHSVRLLFNNAGYVSMSLSADSPLHRQNANFNVNLTIAVRLTHYFANRMIQDPNITRGAICFTSSPAGLMPNPFAAVYGMTKAALTEFAVSIAPELRPDGIDVLVVHPSPVNTNFYTEEATKTSPALALFRKTAPTPQLIADCFFSQLGRAVVYDQGYFPLALKFLMRILDFNLFAYITTLAGGGTAEYKKLSAQRQIKRD